MKIYRQLQTNVILLHWNRRWFSLKTPRYEPFIQSFKTSLISSFWNAGSALNKVTGYDKVEMLKDAVIGKEKLVAERKREFTESKLAYECIIENTRQCQRDLEHLRDRKRIQSLDEINLITKLYEQQLSLEEQEKIAKKRYMDATDSFEIAQAEYLK
jgi:hypothetical protein